jgi:3-phenylpropionate/cinnamic acid dioxygenase small subunit
VGPVPVAGRSSGRTGGTEELDVNEPAAPADVVAVSILLARYAELIDAGDFAGVGALLADAVLCDGDGQPVASGAVEIERLYIGSTIRYADGTPGTAHVITNLIVESTGPDTLTARSRFTVFQGLDDLPLQPVVVGRYVDDFDRGPDGWRFRRRVMRPERWGDVSRHLTFDPRG